MNRQVATPRPRTRRTGAALREELLVAGEDVFATHGFEAASTREIAERAGAHQPQINYHFVSKEQLWRHVVDRLFAQLDGALTASALPRPPAAYFAATVERFLTFSARRPQLNRIINLEASVPTARLEWLVATHLAPRYALMATAWAAVRREGLGAALTPEEVWAVVTSFGALHFANAAMLEALGAEHAVGAPEQTARTLRLLGLDEASR